MMEVSSSDSICFDEEVTAFSQTRLKGRTRDRSLSCFIFTIRNQVSVLFKLNVIMNSVVLAIFQVVNSHEWHRAVIWNSTDIEEFCCCPKLDWTTLVSLMVLRYHLIFSRSHM